MRRKRFALVSVGMDEGNEFVGVMWTKETYGRPEEYMIRLFESQTEAEWWIEKRHPNDTTALFRMYCIKPIEHPPAPADHSGEVEQASEEESEQSNV